MENNNNNNHILIMPSSLMFDLLLIGAVWLKKFPLVGLYGFYSSLHEINSMSFFPIYIWLIDSVLAPNDIKKWANRIVLPKRK